MTTNPTKIGKPFILRHSFKKHLSILSLGIASPQRGDLKLAGPPPGQGAGGGARTRYRKVPADLRAGSLATVPPTPIFRESECG
ncbi:hypothetical protein PoB_003450800 [Plakobranchus ocellatus]|uniref:Uncharacterized protein n=1 Tax=Plakobranchus ocellatus TaxID=259542 RepID=A0AAV4AL23_9GAST|nr:hypothetical protein PoB_003450800 [Plakobranchus ocellatus]